MIGWRKVASFWSRVEVPRLKGDPCWAWRGAKGPTGYGVFSLGRTSPHAHRVAWLIVNGAIADGLVVCHRCDNRNCVNPDHLFLGTQLDNIADMVAKGRQRGPYRPGEKSPTAKLSQTQALELKRRAAAGESQRSLAAEFGVSQPTVADIKRGKTWGHLP